MEIDLVTVALALSVLDVDLLRVGRAVPLIGLDDEEDLASPNEEEIITPNANRMR